MAMAFEREETKMKGLGSYLLKRFRYSFLFSDSVHLLLALSQSHLNVTEANHIAVLDQS